MNFHRIGEKKNYAITNNNVVSKVRIGVDVPT